MAISIQKIKKLDIDDVSNMTVKELRDIIRTGKSYFTGKQEMFARKGEESPAFATWSPKSLSTTGRKTTLAAQAKQVIAKANDKTVTQRGFESWKRDVKSKFGLEGKRLSQEKYNKFLEAYNKFKELNPNAEHQLGEGSPPEEINYADIKIGDVDDMVAQMTEQYRNILNAREERELSDEDFEILR